MYLGMTLRTCSSLHRLDDGARLTARRSRDASRGAVHVVKSECSHDAVIGGIRGVTGRKEGLIGVGLPVSRSRMKNRCGDPVRLKRTPPFAYFVSHGGARFPSLIVVLQGDGVRVDLPGSTFINEKTGITSSTFKTVPDEPVRSFELYLPEGKDHALAANGSLCKNASKMIMPTEFDAQNGAVLKRRTKITVTGCTKHRRIRASSRAGRRAKNTEHNVHQIGGAQRRSK
jgi:hypothetical protein